MSILSKYQKPILIGIALFALLTFSITGVMMTVIGGWFDASSTQKITLANGTQVKVKIEDLSWGRKIAALHRSVVGLQLDLPGFVFSGLAPSFTDTPSQVFAILRRVAMEHEIDVADQDVEKATTFMLRAKKNLMARPDDPTPKAVPPGDFARHLGLGSKADLHELMREAMRLSLYVQTEMHASLDITDAALADYIMDRRKRMKLSFTAFSGKKLEKELRKTPPIAPELIAWMKGLPPAEQAPFKDDVQVSFTSVGFLYEDADPKALADLMKDIEITDADVEARYNEDKERLYKIAPPKEKTEDKPKEGAKEGAKDPKPAADAKKGDAKKGEDKKGGLFQDEKKPDEKKPAEKKPADTAKKPAPVQGPQKPDDVGYVPIDKVKDSILRKLKLEAALRKLLEKAQQASLASLPKPDASKAGTGAAGAAATGDKKPGDKKPAAEKPGDKKPAADPPKTDKKGGLLQAQNKPPMKPPSQEPAPKPQGLPQAALFDLQKWFAEVSKEYKDLVILPAGAKTQRPELFAELSRFGEWDGHWALRTVEEVGALSGSIQRAEKGCFFFQVRDRETDAWRPLDEVKEAAEKLYFETESGNAARGQAADFRALVWKKAEEIEGAKAKALRDGVAKQVDDDLAGWKAGLEAEIKARRDKLPGDYPESAKAEWKKEISEREEQIKKSDEQKKIVATRIESETDVEVKELVEKHLALAFDKAATEAKREVTKLGPFFKDEATVGDPLFSKREDGPEKFLKQSQDALGLKASKVSDPLEDTAGRVWYVVRMDKVEAGGADALSRRHLAAMRKDFTEKRVRNVLTFGYGFNAVKKRYALIDK
ncbi:MAG: hypothetical protein QGG14_06730 [Planctomycetota bacterium]|nr:hypothetical protein [Planctomycetota bacterium]